MFFSPWILSRKRNTTSTTTNTRFLISWTHLFFFFRSLLPFFRFFFEVKMHGLKVALAEIRDYSSFFAGHWLENQTIYLHISLIKRVFINAFCCSFDQRMQLMQPLCYWRSVQPIESNGKLLLFFHQKISFNSINKFINTKKSTTLSTS